MGKDHNKYMSEFFGRMAPTYDLLEIILTNLRKNVIDMIGIRKRKILDVCCGTGTLSIALAKKGHSVVGIDLTRAMLNQAGNKLKKGLDVKFVEGDASKMMFKNSEFDTSVISLSLHDMPHEMREKVLNEMKRVTKKDGKIIIVDYNQPSGFFSRFFLAWAVRYESKYYPSFIKNLLEYYLKKTKLKQSTKKTNFFGVLQTVECKNKK